MLSLTERLSPSARFRFALAMQKHREMKGLRMRKKASQCGCAVTGNKTWVVPSHHFLRFQPLVVPSHISVFLRLRFPFWERRQSTRVDEDFCGFRLFTTNLERFSSN